MSTSPLIIAIDGGSGVGKSSAARLLAKRLNCLYVDTGSHYRAMTHLLQKAGVPYTDAAAVAAKLAHWTLDEQVIDGEAKILLNHLHFGETELRSALVNSEVSYYAAIPAVRKFLLHYQRSQAEEALANEFRGVVMEGRDIGLNVFPETIFKYLLTADAKIKARRRAEEGLVDITDKRDEIDRTLGQFHRAENVTVLDTSALSLEQVVERLYGDVTSRMPR